MKDISKAKKPSAAPEPMAVAPKPTPEDEAKEARDKLKGEIEKHKKLELERLTSDLKQMEWSTIRRNEKLKINPGRWNPNSKEGLQALKNEWKALNLPVNNAFYQKVFEQLEKSFDTDFLKQEEDRSPEVAKIYSNPMDNLDKLNQCDADFASSVRFVDALKSMVLAQDVFQIDTEKQIREGDEDPVFSKVIKVIRDNGVKFRDSIKNRDYATAAVYVVGLYAMWKTYKSMESGTQAKYKKYFFWAAAAYAGTVFAKNAGFDVWKKLGIRAEDAEVEGTPLAAIKRVGDSDVNKLKNLDTFKAIAFVNLRTLHGKFNETNDPEKQFIDPAQFPRSFPEFLGMRAEDIAKDSYKARDYHQKGHELYILVKAMQTAYDKKLKHKTNMSFEEALNRPILRDSVVFDYMLQINDLFPKTEVTKLFSRSGAFEVAEKRFDKVFGKRLAFHLEGEIEPGIFEATVMGYPIIIRRETDQKRYLVFKRDVYEKEGGSPSYMSKMAEIPFEGPAKAVRGQIDREITKGMEKRLDIFVNNSKGGVQFEGGVKFENGYWYTEMKYMGENLVKGETKAIRVRVGPGRKGNSLDITNLQNRTLIYVRNVTNLSGVREDIVLASLTSQSGFEILHWLYVAGNLRFFDKDPTDKIFEVQVGGMKEPIKIEFDEGEYKFAGKTDEERLEAQKKLLEQHGFKSALMDSVGKMPRMEKAISDLERLVNETPEAYFTHFLTSIPKWFTEATGDYWRRGFELQDITGPVAKNYFKGLLEAQKELVLAKVSYAVGNSADLSEASDKVNAIVPYSIKKFEDFYDHFSKINTEYEKAGKKFDEEAFGSKILEELAGVGIQSEDYSHWYKRFANSTLGRFGGDDIRTERAREAGRAVALFAYHTAPCDDPSAQGADTTLLQDKDAKKDSAEYKKAEKYDLYARYVNYVAWKLDSWITSGEKMPAGPTAELGIKLFEHFKESPEGAAEMLVDITPRLEMSTDYVTFDDYLAMSSSERSSVSKEDIILPRTSCELTFKGAADREALKLFFEIGGASNTTKKLEASRVAVFERRFSDKMTTVLDELAGKYKVKAGAFDELREQYSLGFKAEELKATKGEIIVEYTPTELVKEIHRLEGIINGSSRTVTGTYQDTLIKNRVAEIVRQTIVNNNFFDRYFDRTTIPGTLSDVWEDIKAFIFG